MRHLQDEGRYEQVGVFVNKLVSCDFRMGIFARLHERSVLNFIRNQIGLGIGNILLDGR